MIEQILSEIKNLDIPGISAEYILHKIADKAIPKLMQTYNKIKKRELKGKPDLELKEDVIITQMINNVKQTLNWCHNISFRDLKKPKAIKDVFIHIDFYLTPKRVHFNSSLEERISLEKALSFEDSNYIILGGPGAGKTTLMKFVANSIFEDSEYFGKRFIMPFVIRLRDINKVSKGKLKDRNSFYYVLIEKFGIKLNYLEPQNLANIEEWKEVDEEYYSILKTLVTDFLNTIDILLVLDGFDEIPDNNLKNTFAIEIRELSLSLYNSKLILTTRTGEFNYEIENSTTYEICSLSSTQIRLFVNKWIEESSHAENLYDQIMKSPFVDTTIRPLNLAHLCAIYERYFKIPDRPKSVYIKIVYLLLEEWDVQRSVQRVSKYSNFPTDRKIEFLSRFSYILTTTFNKSVFSRREIEFVYKLIYDDFDLPEYESKSVIDEIESYTGLFIQSGVDQFEFSHKSLQEFLTAEYIAKSPVHSYPDKIILNLPNEIAIATAISANSNSFLASIIIDRFKSFNDIDTKFLHPFIQRLVLEKPDFNKEASLACAISYLFTIAYDKFKIKELIGKDRINKYPDIEQQLHKSQFIITQIKTLIKSHKNIVKSFKNLANHYTMKAADVDKVRDNVTIELHNPFNIYQIYRYKEIEGISITPKELTLNEFMASYFYNLT